MNPLRRVVDHPLFTGAVITVIIANAVVLGLQTYEGLDREYGDLLVLLNALFLAFFVAEISLRVASYLPRPWEYFREGWNVFDFLAVALAFVPGLRENTTILRLARLARIVRVVHLLPDVRILITAVIRSLPPLASMAILTTLILFIYGMVGWQLFGDELPAEWGNIGEAMLTLFVMLTLENFPIYMDAGMEIHPWSWIFFVSFILTAAFIVINVLIGIVLNSMEEARELARRESLAPGEAVPVLERIDILRSALDELERELQTPDVARVRQLGSDPTPIPRR